jgi:hypothetical protein
VLGLGLEAANKVPDFESEHFAFYSEAPRSVVEKQTLKEVAESTRKLLEPWTPEWKTRRRIRLFDSEAAYLNAGGIRVSGGVHRSDNGDVLLRLTDGNISKAEQRILIHEVTSWKPIL